ncbi:hypothetical protein AAVH_19723 [Aphelenchoides avenae]|nr:hypothetical protein AAVH_19723 [Aphelenchus avenae]
MSLLNIVSIVYFVLLRRYNVRRNNVQSTASLGHLSRRYQMTENLTVIEQTLPWTVITCIVITCMSIALSVLETSAVYQIAAVTYFVVLSIYVTLSYLIVARSCIVNFVYRVTGVHRRVANVADQADQAQYFRILSDAWR